MSLTDAPSYTDRCGSVRVQNRNRDQNRDQDQDRDHNRSTTVPFVRDVQIPNVKRMYLNASNGCAYVTSCGSKQPSADVEQQTN
ncbi:hypothetical protein INR49_004202 [Caranx melampygus]|nr:hypothetical protein INR49_004202 [Caranx melampygus]